jgi:hypothetical protein
VSTFVDTRRRFEYMQIIGVYAAEVNPGWIQRGYIYRDVHDRRAEFHCFRHVLKEP